MIGILKIQHSKLMQQNWEIYYLKYKRWLTWSATEWDSATDDMQEVK